MPDDPFPGYGLHTVDLSHQDIFVPYFASLAEPLSDYTFSQIYTWRNSLHIVWKIIDSHLCVFANGTGDLTLLIPPIGQTRSNKALKQAFELMDDYNASQGVPERTRVEYASEELLGRLDRSRLDVAPMGTDYVYDVRRMIDLAGGDLSSKRQAKNRFMRLYSYRIETYEPAKHLEDCLALLDDWRVHQDAQHLEEPNTNCIKRQKETIATELALRSASDLGFKGMVVYAGAQQDSACNKQQMTDPMLRAFTFGEYLGNDSSSIVIEKTDLEIKGLAQFIFSEFCRQSWSDRPMTNVGDDWGLESLAWTKMSYRPVKLLQKYTLGKVKPAVVPVECDLSSPSIRLAGKDDLTATVDLEKACFSSDLSLKKRQLQYLQQRSTAVFLVAEEGGNIIGEGIALVRQHKGRTSGRIYSLAVNKNHRGKKIGRRLLEAMVYQLESRGVKRIYLEVEQSNLTAVTLYERTGFRCIGKLPNYYSAGSDGLHMMLDLNQAPTLFDLPIES